MVQSSRDMFPRRSHILDPLVEVYSGPKSINYFGMTP